MNARSRLRAALDVVFGFVGRRRVLRRHDRGDQDIRDDVTYGFVEPEIRSAWAEGARRHLAGSITEAVAHWSSAMAQQLRLAQQAGILQDYRYFGSIWTCAIGHIANLTTYAQARELGMIKDMRFVVGATSPVANRAYLDYLDEYFDIITDGRVLANLDIRYRSELPSVVKLSDRWVFLIDAMRVVQERWLQEQRPPLLRLRDDHRCRGEQVLRDWGVPDGSWFVTLHVREGGRVSGNSETDSIRNCDIQDYLDAIAAITAAGGWVIRIGAPDYEPLPPMPNVIDYATTKNHEDWIDVFLLGGAQFVIATNSGPAWVSVSYGIPVLFTNWAPVGINPFWPGATVLRKTVFSLSDGLNLPPDQQLEEPLSQLESSAALRRAGYGVRSNSAREITTATIGFLDLHACSGREE